MLRRDFLAFGVIAAVLLAAPAAVWAKDDDIGGDDSGGRRGRGSDDTGFDDRGGGSRSGHGSVEERAAILGDDRGDRAEARLRENLKEDAIQDRDALRRGRGGNVSFEHEHDNAPAAGGARGLIADLLDLFRERER